MRRALLVAVVVLLAGCSEDERQAPTATATGRGLTAELPEGWQATRKILTPRLGDPRQAFLAATFALRYRETECAQIPGSALEDLGPRDALVELQERGTGGGGFPSRPARFGPGLGTESTSSDCVPRAVFREHWFEFSDAGRNFHVRVAFGPEAPAAVQDEAWSILDSLRIDPSVRPDWENAG